MIYLTNAPNDADLVEAMGKIASPGPLRYGDFSFFGYWESWSPVRVCGDRKKLGDLVRCLNDGRYVQQVQDAWGAGFEYQVLVVEALMRPNPRNGMLQYLRGDGWEDFDITHGRGSKPRLIEYSRIVTFLWEVAFYMGVVVMRSSSLRETVSYITDLYRLFQKPPEQHRSLAHFFSPPPPRAEFIGRPGLVQRIAKEYKGVDWVRSRAIGESFQSPREMVMADEERWMEIKGIGEVLAKSAVKENGGENG